MNSCSFTGRATADIELKNTQSGVPLCSFTLAVKRPRVKDTTDFIRFTAFRQSAEYLSKYAAKGSMIEVSGVLTSRNWEDKNGNKQTSFEVVVDNASVLESRSTPSIDVPHADPLLSLASKIDDFEEVAADGDLPF